MRTTFAIAAVAAAFALVPAAASAACATAWSAPPFTVTMMDPPVHYRLDIDSQALRKVAGANGMADLKGEIPYGLTIGRYGLRVAIDTERLSGGDGACLELRAAHVEIGLKQLEVVVDRRFAAGSCERQAVLDHESGHVGAFREAARHYLPAVERTLAALRLPRDVAIDGTDSARAAFLQPITAALKPIFDAMNARAHDANRRLDLPQNYAAVFAKCRHW